MRRRWRQAWNTNVLSGCSGRLHGKSQGRERRKYLLNRCSHTQGRTGAKQNSHYFTVAIRGAVRENGCARIAGRGEVAALDRERAGIKAMQESPCGRVVVSIFERGIAEN